MSIEIRPLTAEDADTYYALRLRSVKEHPEAFLASYEEESAHGVEPHRERLAAKEGRADDFVLAAFDGAGAVGMVGAYRPAVHRAKGRHIAMIWGVYVAPEARGRGVGRQLMEEAIRRIRAAGGFDVVQLGVGKENPAARALYASVGFETYGIEERSMKLDGRYIAEELMALLL